MNNKFSFCISFSGITLRFTSPTNIILPECFNDLLCEDTDSPTAEYQVELLDAPLRPEGCAVYNQKDFCVYKTPQGTLRIYTPLEAEDGCQVACLMRKSGIHTMYYPASMWERYRKYWHCTHLICGETLLAMNNALLLHSSVVEINSESLLFCGESGAGKSTQASLWEKYKNAKILNGDRCVIYEKDGIFYGGGSPWSGTSGIYQKEHFPIAGIILLKKSDKNTIKQINSTAFPRLFSQTTLNTWDKKFMDTITDIYVQLLSNIPVFELACRPDEDSVNLVYNTVFAKEEKL